MLSKYYTYKLKPKFIHLVAGFQNLLFLKQQINSLHKNKRIIVLNFHNPDATTFRKHIAFFVQHGFYFLTLSEVSGFINNHFCPRKASIFITFDDGWQGNLNLLPVINHYKIPVCFFLNTQPIQGNGQFWNSSIKKFRENLPAPYNSNPLLLYSIPIQERLLAIDKLYRVLPPTIQRESLTIEEVKHLAQNPLVSFGAHTHTHAVTAFCDNEELNNEIKINKQLLEEWTEQEIYAFAYPNGKFNENERDVLINNGISFAFILGNRFLNHYTDPFLLPRFGSVERSFSESICKITGLWGNFINRQTI